MESIDLEIIRFEYTWCDYLTKCPYNQGCMVGDYDCSQCQYHVSIEEEGKQYTTPTTDYKKYAIAHSGIVGCRYMNSFEKRLKEIEELRKKQKMGDVILEK